MISKAITKGYKLAGYTIDDYFLSVPLAKKLIKTDLRNINSFKNYTSSYKSNFLIQDELINFISYIKGNNLELWDYIFLKDIEGYSIVNQDGEKVGYINTREDIYNSDSLYILKFEVYNQRRGIGSAIISQLKKQGYSLSGISLISSKAFWVKQGAIFKSNYYFNILKEDF